jgi:acetyl-CoA carboxylase biotin carboxyl carrier protein
VILTQKDVAEIVSLLDGSRFDELVVETARFKLTVRRSGTGWTQETETRGAEAPKQAQAKRAAPKVALALGEIAVHPPLVGTFYRAPKPGAPPFVEVGSAVDEHTVVAIIESMKLMTPVHAGARGTVSEICVENAGFVEQDSVLMKLKS